MLYYLARAPHAVSEFLFWSRSHLCQRPPAFQARFAPALRPIEDGDEVVVSRAAERSFGVMAANALSLLPGAFSLPSIARRFAALGLARGRKTWVISEAGGAIDAALLKESASPGVNPASTSNSTSR